MSKSIKILVGYHKPSYLFKDDIFVPIHCGRAVSNVISKDGYVTSTDAQWLLDNTIGDDTGDNISEKNREYCECTALYWAWKNYDKIGNPDYIGFMQYSRHFILKENCFSEKELDLYEKTYATKKIIYPSYNYMNFLGLNYDNIMNVLSEYGGICTNPSDLSMQNVKNLREDYEKIIPGVNVKDYDCMIAMASKMYPNMADYIINRSEQTLKSAFQMWILPKKIFFDYMEFMFSILFECEKYIDVSSYSTNGKRTMGYLAELLCDFYMNFYKNKYKIKGVDICQILTTLPEEQVSYSKINKYRILYLKYKIASLVAPKNKIFRMQKRKFRDLICAVKNVKSYRG